MIINAMQCCANGEINGWRKLKVKKIKRWGCGENLWRMKWACVYLSSPIDHHLKQEEWGRETWIQFNTLLHCRRRRSSSGGVKALASDMAGVGFFFPCHALPGGAYVPSTNRSNFLISNKVPSTWGSRHSYFLYFLRLYWLHIKWLRCFQRSKLHNFVRRFKKTNNKNGLHQLS